MFTNQPCTYRTRLRFIETPDPAPGGGATTSEPKDDDLGFPKDTPVNDMTPEQKAAYWQNQSKVQQRARETAEKATKAYEKFGTVDDLQKTADAAEQARLDALDDNQKAIEAAREAGRNEGAAEHAGKHLGTAITAMLIAHTKGAQESFEDAQARVAGAIEFADLTKFVGGNGDLDAEKVQTFAKSIGSTDSGGNEPGGFDLLGAMQRQSTPAPGSTGSVAAMEQAHYDRLTSNKQ